MKNIIKDVFERYGFIDVDAMEPGLPQLVADLKKHHIIFKKIGSQVGPAGWDEYRLTGPYGEVRWMLLHHWNPLTDPKDTSEIDEWLEDFKII